LQEAVVDTVKPALVAPPVTVTLAGTVAIAVLLLESATVAPPAGAAPLRVTVPVEAVPPVTLVGLRLNEERVAGGVTVRTAESLAAQMVTQLGAVTELVETVKFPDVAPAGTVTLTGTVATNGLPLKRVTTVPPAGAATFRITVPVETAPPVTLGGFRVNEARLGEVTVSTVETLTPP